MERKGEGAMVEVPENPKRLPQEHMHATRRGDAGRLE